MSEIPQTRYIMNKNLFSNDIFKLINESDGSTKLVFNNENVYGIDYQKILGKRAEILLSSVNEYYSSLNKKQDINSDNIYKLTNEIVAKHNYFTTTITNILYGHEDYSKAVNSKIESIETNIKILEKKKENISKNGWFFVSWRLKKYDTQINNLKNKVQKYKQTEGNFFANFAQQLTILRSNRAFANNLSMNLPDNFEAKNSSLMDILMQKESYTTLQSIQSSSNNKTAKGSVNEVSFINQDTDNEQVVKPGKLTISAPKLDERFQKGEFQQNYAMGNFGNTKIENINDKTEYTVDSSFRQLAQYYMATKILKYDCIIPTQIAIDNTVGNVAVMDKAKGTIAGKVMLFKNENDLKSCEQKIKKGYKLIVITPKLQESALNLAINDFICAQSDRHSGNFFIDIETGKIQGIDNDSCFLICYSKEQLYDMMKTKIPFVTPEIKKNILDLDADEITKRLGGLIDRGILGTLVKEKLKERIDMLKKYVENECPCYEQYNETTIQAFYNAHNLAPDWLKSTSNPIAILSFDTIKKSKELNQSPQQKNINLKHKSKKIYIG